MKSKRLQPNFMRKMTKFIRILFAILVSVALVGVPTVQAAVAIPCGATVATMADQLTSGHSPAPTPCKEKMPGCADMAGCGASVTLDAHVVVATNEQVWTAAAYWPITASLESLLVKPDLGPPITI